MRFLTLMLLILALLLPSACGDSGQVVDNADSPSMNRVDAALAVDGSHEGYPEPPIESIGVVIHLAQDGDFLYVHLRAEIDGWIAVGFNAPRGGMDGANMVIGYLESGAPAVRDDVGRGRTHTETTVNSVEDFSLLQENGTRIFEFSFPLRFPEDTGYRLTGLTPGETYTMLLAYNSNSDEINRQHNRFAMIDFTVAP